MPGSTPTPQMYSAIVDEVVTQQFMRSEWDSVKQVNVVLERFEKGGRINFDASGKFVDWVARVGRHEVSRRADLAKRNFERKQHRVSYTAPYTFLEALGLLSERDVMFLNSSDAITNISNRMLGEMSEDFSVDLNSRILTENAGSNTVGGATAYAGSDVPLYGLPTLFGYGSTAQDYDFEAKTTSGNVGAGDKEVLPNTTYCGVSTHPINAISGVDNKESEATSPVITNWSSTAWDGSSTTWAKNAAFVLTHHLVRQQRGNSTEDRPDLAIMTQKMYIDFKNQLRTDTSQQVVIVESPTSPDAGMYPRLFLNYEGLTCVFDVDQLAGVCHILNTRKGEFKMYPQRPAGMKSGAIKGQTKEMFKVSQMPDIDQGGHKVVSTLVGQMCWQPRYQGMSYNFA